MMCMKCDLPILRKDTYRFILTDKNYRISATIGSSSPSRVQATTGMVGPHTPKIIGSTCIYGPALEVSQPARLGHVSVIIGPVLHSTIVIENNKTYSK